MSGIQGFSPNWKTHPAFCEALLQAKKAGVVPLAFATGSASELRQALGTSVFFGMIGVTFLGLLFTPVFFYLIRKNYKVQQ